MSNELGDLLVAKKEALWPFACLQDDPVSHWNHMSSAIHSLDANRPFLAANRLHRFWCIVQCTQIHASDGVEPFSSREIRSVLKYRPLGLIWRTIVAMSSCRRLALGHQTAQLHSNALFESVQCGRNCRVYGAPLNFLTKSELTLVSSGIATKLPMSRAYGRSGQRSTHPEHGDKVSKFENCFVQLLFLLSTLQFMPAHIVFVPYKHIVCPTMMGPGP